MKDIDRATEFWEKAFRFQREGDLKNAEKYTRLGLKHESAPPIWTWLVEVLRGQRRYSEALAAAKTAEKTRLSRKWQRTVSKEELASGLSLTYVQIALIHDRTGRRVLAERYYRRSLEAKPTVESYVLLGVLLGGLGRDQEQKKCYQKALKLEPDLDEAHYNLGVWYKDHGKYSLAERHLRKAIELDPKYVEALSELGTLMWRLGKTRFRESEPLLRKAVRLDPRSPACRLYLANTLWYLKRSAAAKKQFLTAISLDPSSDVVWSQYAHFLAREGDPAEAERGFKKAIRLGPGNKYAHFNYGRFLLESGRTREARKMLARAARLGHERAKRLKG